MAMHSLRRHPEWVVVLAGVSAALHVGKLSPAIPVLRDALGVSLLQAGFLLSLVQFAGMLFGLLAGLAADGFGLRRSMLVGLVVLSIAGALGAMADRPETLLLLRGCEGFGFLLTVTPAPGLIRRLAPAGQLPWALGLWGTYMPMGTAMALLAGPAVIDAVGWRNWWLLLAAVTAIMAVGVARAIAPDSERLPVVNTALAPAMQRVTWQLRVRRTLSAPGPWLVALCFALYSGQWLAVIGFLPSIVAQSGRVGVAASSLLALAALVNVVGNLASGRLLQRGVLPWHLLASGFLAMAVGAVLAFADIGLNQSSGVVALGRYLGVLVFSMVGGLIPGTLFLMAVRLAPDEFSVSTTVGWMQQLSALGQFLGPPLVAWLAASAGGWQWTWVATGISSVLGLMVAYRVQRQLRVARS
ncbi:MAG: MFS transporter [Burkholderiaceae bacterium]